MQQARVWARLGQRREAEDALRAGATALARLPPPAHPEDHFAFDAAKLSFYAAMCFTWLHQTEQAEEHARQAIAHSTETPGVIRWPTRFAVAQVDLALLAVQRGQLDEAALRGTAALDSGRVVASTLGWSPNSTTSCSVTTARWPRYRTSTRVTWPLVARRARDERMPMALPASGRSGLPVGRQDQRRSM